MCISIHVSWSDILRCIEFSEIIFNLCSRTARIDLTFFMKSGCPNAPFPQGQRRWCSTRINPSTGIHVSGQNEYGYCNSHCPNHDTSKFPSHILFQKTIFIKCFIFSDLRTTSSTRPTLRTTQSTRPPVTTNQPTPPASTCRTTSDSPNPNRPCVFPFQFQGQTYSGGLNFLKLY